MRGVTKLYGGRIYIQRAREINGLQPEASKMKLLKCRKGEEKKTCQSELYI